MRRSTLKTRNRAGQALRLAAQAVSRSHNSLGAFYLCMQARLGPKAAIVATAHKLARIVYHLLRHRLPFRDFSAADYERRARGARDRQSAQQGSQAWLDAGGISRVIHYYLKFLSWAATRLSLLT